MRREEKRKNKEEQTGRMEGGKGLERGERDGGKERGRGVIYKSTKKKMTLAFLSCQINIPRTAFSSHCSSLLRLCFRLFVHVLLYHSSVDHKYLALLLSYLFKSHFSSIVSGCNFPFFVNLHVVFFLSCS